MVVLSSRFLHSIFGNPGSISDRFRTPGETPMKELLMNRRAGGVENESSLHQLGSILQHGSPPTARQPAQLLFVWRGQEARRLGWVWSSLVRRAAHSSLALAEWATRHPRRSTGNSGIAQGRIRGSFNQHPAQTEAGSHSGQAWQVRPGRVRACGAGCRRALQPALVCR